MIKVCKFGGSSLAEKEGFERVKELVQEGERQVVVVSAPGKSARHGEKVTDLLFDVFREKNGANYKKLLAKAKGRLGELGESLGASGGLIAEINSLQAEEDEAKFISRGEYFTAKITAEFLGFKFLDSALFITFGYDGRLDTAETERKFKEIYVGEKIVVPGFYGGYNCGKIRLFPRGGGDVTGAIMASLVNADLYENMTDVTGVLSAPPNLVTGRVIEKIGYERLELYSRLGAEVLHPSAVAPAKEKNIPILVRSTFGKEDVGTLICADVNCEPCAGVAVRGGFCCVAFKRHCAVTVRKFLAETTAILRSFGADAENISIFSGGVTLFFKGDNSLAERFSSSVVNCGLAESVRIETDISVVGVLCKNVAKGVVNTLSSLSKNGVEPCFINLSEDDLYFAFGVENKFVKTSVLCAHNSAKKNLDNF